MGLKEYAKLYRFRDLPYRQIYLSFNKQGTENLIYCFCGCGRRISAYDSKGRPRRYVNGHNRIKNKPSSKFRINPDDFDKKGLVEMINVLFQVLDRFHRGDLSVSRTNLILEQEKMIKDMDELGTKIIREKEELVELFLYILSKYIGTNMLSEEDESKLVDKFMFRSKDTFVDANKFNQKYLPKLKEMQIKS
jgi:hypothetical protein